jgi:type I restriction enzyme S subunit
MSWEKVRLGDVIEILSGFAFDSKKFHDSAGMPLIRIRDIKRSYSETFYNGPFDDKFIIKKGDVIIGMDGEFNISDWKGVDSLLNQRVCKINSYKKDKIDKRYLLHFLPIELKFIEDKTSFVTVKHLSIKDINEIEIPLPPLATQKRIADILDTADALRRKDQELLTKYDQLAQAIFIDMFGDPVKNEKGWEVKKLGDLIAKLETGVSVNSTDEIFDDNKYCVLKTSCVYSGEFNPTQAKVIIENEISKAKLNPQKDSIIISRMNTPELVGKSVYIPENYPNLFLPDRLWQTVKTKEKHSSLWLSFALKSEMFMDQVSKICSGTSGSMKNISKKAFLDLKIIFPAFEKQKQFEILILNLKNQIKFQQNSHSTSLFSSFIQQAFNGTLVS